MNTQINPDGGSRSIAELTTELTEQTGRLARREIELARAELTAKGRRAGVGLGAYGGAGVVGLLALGALTAGGIMILATVIVAWLSAAIVGAGLALVAGTLALIGRSRVKEMSPVPEQTVETLREDAATVGSRAREGRA